MHPILRLCALALRSLAVVTLLGSVVYAVPGAGQTLLDDDFDDGFIASIYNDLCSSGAVESGGALRFPGANLGCFAFFGLFPAAIIEVLEPGLVVPGNTIRFEIRTDRIPTILMGQEAGELVGLGLNPGANVGLGLNLIVQRFPASLEVSLYNPLTSQVVQTATIALDPDSDPELAASDTIELRLDLGPNVGNSIFPVAYYRLCSTGSCLDGTGPPFIPLATVPGSAGSDSIALADAARLTLQGLAQVGEVDAFSAERLRVVPEPSTGLAIGWGALGLGVIRLARRRVIVRFVDA